ncbi:MCE family protein [bacterium]|nr:MCE family protein [bacterium]
MEKPNSRGSNNFIVGMFVAVSLLVVAGFVVFMGGGSIFQGEYRLKVRFEDARGLNIGAPVYMSGLLIGRVSSKDLPHDTSNGIDVSLSLSKKYQERIREDSEALTSTAGMLGDQVVVLTAGSDEYPMLKPDDFVKTKEIKKLEDYIADGGSAVESIAKAAFNLNKLLSSVNGNGEMANIMKNLDRITTNLAKHSGGGKDDKIGPMLESLKNVMAKVDRGEGTLGALVNDPTLHEDMRILLGGAQRSKIMRFLVREAISKNEANQSPKPK